MSKIPEGGCDTITPPHCCPHCGANGPFASARTIISYSYTADTRSEWENNYWRCEPCGYESWHRCTCGPDPESVKLRMWADPNYNPPHTCGL